MADNTGIEWADATFNPWEGCTRVSPACDHCYAEARARRFGNGRLWQGERRRTSAANWRQPLKWDREARAAGVRKRVFCASLADVFDNQVPTDWVIDLLDLIRRTQNLDWLLLTKRPQNIVKRLREALNQIVLRADAPDPLLNWIAAWLDGQPPENVWLGTTTENQEEADRRIPILLSIPAARHFVSAEPLLGPIDLTPWLEDGIPTSEQVYGPRGLHYLRHGAPRIDWTICGGESGPGARPMSIQWARSLRDQCAATHVAFFFKQFGEWRPAGGGPAGRLGKFAFGDYEYDPGRMVEHDGYPRQFTMFGSRNVMERVGKKAAGRLLDGVEHSEFPA